MRFEQNHPPEQIVNIMSRIYSNGMTTTSGGNISIKDDEGNIWITPAGVDKSSLRREDIICVMSDGTTQGIHRPSSELPFHQMAYKTRPDLKAVLHAHPPALVSFSIVGKVPDTKLVPNIHAVCGEVAIAKYALPGSTKLGEEVADVLKKGINTVVLENHGVFVGGETLMDAFIAFETLDYCAKLQIYAAGMGKIRKLNDEETDCKDEIRMGEFALQDHTYSEIAIRREMCCLIRRAYEMKLVGSIMGDFSQRIAGNDFIITPYGVDRKNMKEEDLILIQNGRREAGKTLGYSTKLHKYIYENNPEINSIIVAQPPNTMAFAVTDIEFNSRTIPESYILLRDPLKLPYGSFAANSKRISDTLSNKTPVIMMNNKCIIVIGNSLLNAYDRLEVLEYSAKSIIMSMNIGPVVPIGDKDIADIIEAFKL